MVFFQPTSASIAISTCIGIQDRSISRIGRNLHSAPVTRRRRRCCRRRLTDGCLLGNGPPVEREGAADRLIPVHQRIDAAHTQPAWEATVRFRYEDRTLKQLLRSSLRLHRELHHIASRFGGFNLATSSDGTHLLGSARVFENEPFT